jgi:ribosome-binding protein aMBF1 (putative translation factor)
MTKFKELRKKWENNPEFKVENEALEQEFALMRAVIAARVSAGLTQEDLAKRMETTQATIARLEAGKQMPSTRTLEKLAKATGTKLRISFEKAA